MTKPTTTGIIYFGLLGALAGTVIYTGNNRIALIVAAMMSGIIVDFLMAKLNLSKLFIVRHLPSDIFAGAQNRGSLEIKNKQKFDSYSISIRELDGGGANNTINCVQAGNTAFLPVTWQFHERGKHGLGRLEISSTWPLGLFKRTKIQPEPAMILVYPGKYGLEKVGTTNSIGSGANENSLPGDSELTCLKDYQIGDPVKSIHWPTSAKTGHLVVVLRGSESHKDIIIDLEEKPSERSIRKVCSMIVYHIHLNHAVGMRGNNQYWAPRSGELQKRRLLTYLATLPRSQE